MRLYIFVHTNRATRRRIYRLVMGDTEEGAWRKLVEDSTSKTTIKQMKKFFTLRTVCEGSVDPKVVASILCLAPGARVHVHK